MELQFTSSIVQDCSNGCIYHYIIEPTEVKEILHEDNEINNVLQKKLYRKRRTDMFHLLQECVSKSIQSLICSQLIMIAKPGQYRSLCLSGKILTDCTTITDNDIIVIPSGSNQGIYTGGLLQLQEIIQATGRFCEILVENELNTPYEKWFSKVHITVHEPMNTKVIDEQIIELKRQLTQLENVNIELEDRVFQFCIKKSELEDVITQLTQQQKGYINKNDVEKQDTETNTYETVKQCVDEVNDYVKNILNKTINGKKQLTPYNLLEEVVSYYNDCKYQIKSINRHIDIVDVVKEMLLSKEYILSDFFKKNKLDLKDIQFKFKMLTSPETISKDEILAEVFNIDNTVSLI